MSGPNEVPVPYGHPDNDLLADLAAEVLAEDLALQVQHHVMSCARCAGLLADAESVRSMLLQTEAEAMPLEVLARLERAMAVARQEDQLAGSPARGQAADDTDATTLLTRVPGAEPARKDGGRRIVRSSGPATGRMPAAGPATGAMATGGPKTSRLNRMSQQTQGLRRQAIEEQKADRPSRLAQLAPVLKIAAGVLVVAGIGAAAVQLRNSGEEASSDSAVTAAGGGSALPVLAPVQSTKTSYAKSTLDKQVKTLIASTQQQAQRQGVQDESAAGGDADNSAKAAAPTAPDPSVNASAPNQLLRSPEALRACLDDIGAGSAQPVAVDLARYAAGSSKASREAAIIVLPADGGGYDVWVVARDCRPGTDGTIDVVTVQP